MDDDDDDDAMMMGADGMVQLDPDADLSGFMTQETFDPNELTPEGQATLARLEALLISGANDNDNDAAEPEEEGQFDDADDG